MLRASDGNNNHYCERKKSSQEVRSNRNIHGLLYKHKQASPEWQEAFVPCHSYYTAHVPAVSSDDYQIVVQTDMYDEYVLAVYSEGPYPAWRTRTVLQAGTQASSPAGQVTEYGVRSTQYHVTPVTPGLFRRGLQASDRPLICTNKQRSAAFCQPSRFHSDS